MKLMLPLAIAALLAACATAPRPLQGQYSTLVPEQAASQQATGERVRWGGRIVAVEPHADRSCFEVVSLPLTVTGRPRDVDRSQGRFVACRQGFYEPEVFAAGREITISGQVEGFETRMVGEFDYRYPRVAADVVYLWPERRDRMYYDRPMFYGRFGYWW